MPAPIYRAAWLPCIRTATKRLCEKAPIAWRREFTGDFPRLAQTGYHSTFPPCRPTRSGESALLVSCGAALGCGFKLQVLQFPTHSVVGPKLIEVALKTKRGQHPNIGSQRGPRITRLNLVQGGP